MLFLAPISIGAGTIQYCPVDTQSMSVKDYALYRVIERWGWEYWDSYNYIVEKESKWYHLAQNPESSAHGLCQFLDSTYESYGGKTEDPKEQIDMCIDYIEDRYNNPDVAYNFHIQNNWY